MSLDWAKRMRFMIVGGIVLALVLGAAVTAFLVMYKAPSCIDGKQNRNETGIDCGGSCTYLCTAQVDEPNILFTRALPLPGNRTDVVAYVQNPNKNAEAKRAPYTVDLYAADATIVARIQGFIDLPAGKTVPVFIRAAAQGSNVARAFIQFDQEKIPWVASTQEYVVPKVIESSFTDGMDPRISAKLFNDTYDAEYEIRAVAIAFDSSGTAVGASETLVPVIRAQSSVPITFTWNVPFATTATRFEILPTVPLP